MQQLNHERQTNAPETSSAMNKVFAVLFPAGPAVNSLLATAYISGPPSTSRPLNSPYYLITDIEQTSSSPSVPRILTHLPSQSWSPLLSAASSAIPFCI